jgi:hypothetical protein
MRVQRTAVIADDLRAVETGLAELREKYEAGGVRDDRLETDLDDLERRVWSLQEVSDGKRLDS